MQETASYVVTLPATKKCPQAEQVDLRQVDPSIRLETLMLNRLDEKRLQPSEVDYDRGFIPYSIEEVSFFSVELCLFVTIMCSLA